VIETNDNEQGRQTDEPEAEASARASVIWNTASVLKRNAVVWSGDFVADERTFDPARSGGPGISEQSSKTKSS